MMPRCDLECLPELGRLIAWKVANALPLLSRKITLKSPSSATRTALYPIAFVPSTVEVAPISVSLRALTLVRTCQIVSNSLGPRRASKTRHIHAVAIFPHLVAHSDRGFRLVDVRHTFILLLLIILSGISHINYSERIADNASPVSAQVSGISPRLTSFSLRMSWNVFTLPSLSIFRS